MNKIRVQVLVRLRDGVLDVQGKTIEQSLKGVTGSATASDLRVGKLIELTIVAEDFASACAEARSLCETVLTNPVIETFELRECA